MEGRLVAPAASRSPARERSCLIAGAGLAGLSLAVALLERGWSGPLALVDRRTAYARDRTWCTWDVPGALGPFAPAVSRRWASWVVVGPDGREAVHRDPGRPYVHLDARDVHALALARLARDGVAPALGVAVQDVRPGRVATASGTLTADVVVDARGVAPAPGPGAIALTQGLLGWEVEVEHPVFDPARATLMDLGALRPADPRHLRFLYVLPFGTRRALVEDTSIGRTAPADDVRRAALTAWLAGAGAGRFTVAHEERGRIPMALGATPRRPGVVAVGQAGGAVRASSGYAFARTQRHVAAVADALVAGREPPHRAGGRRAAALDAVFLQALDADPAAFGDRFRALVARTPAAAFARFMADASSPADELRVAAAMPPLPFARAALRATGASRPG